MAQEQVKPGKNAEGSMREARGKCRGLSRTIITKLEVDALFICKPPGNIENKGFLGL